MTECIDSITACFNVYSVSVAVLEFSFWGVTGVATLSSVGGGHTTNAFVLNYRVCNHLCQIINT